MSKGHMKLAGTLKGIRAIVFDVGETLVDENRMWSEHANQAGISPLVLFAKLGSLIERGEDHRLIWSELGVGAPESGVQIERSDLYPDALACLEKARASGRIVGIAGNQPAGLEAQLRVLGFTADFIAASREWGVSKPSKEFFTRVIAATGVSASEILYVGDRLDNDILPAKSVGMRTAFLVRGPWAHIQARWAAAESSDLRLDSLGQLKNALT